MRVLATDDCEYWGGVMAVLRLSWLATRGTDKSLPSQRCFFAAPSDLVASTSPCLLCTFYISSLSEDAGRCSPLHTPCTCSFAERAGRCLTLHTPCTCSFAERSSLSGAGRLLLPFPPSPFLALLPPEPPSAPSPHPAFLRRCNPYRSSPSKPLLSHCPRDPCPCRRRRRHPHQLPCSSPRPRLQNPGRRLPPQAPCPCRCCPFLLRFASPVLPPQPHLSRPRCRRPRVTPRAPRPPEPQPLSVQPPRQRLPPLTPGLSDRALKLAVSILSAGWPRTDGPQNRHLHMPS